MLKIDEITVRYGATTGINKISLEVNEGEIVTLIVPTVRVNQPRCVPSMDWNRWHMAASAWTDIWYPVLHRPR